MVVAVTRGLLWDYKLKLICHNMLRHGHKAYSIRFKIEVQNKSYVLENMWA